MFRKFFIDAVKYWKQNSLMHAYIKLPIRSKSFQDKTIAFNKKTNRSFLMKSKETNFWEQEVRLLLNAEKDAVSRFKLMGIEFNPKTQILLTVWSFSYLNNFTAKNEVNSLVPDLENGKKAIQDILINEVAGIDDRFVLCSLDRRITGNDGISLHLFLLDRKSVDELDVVN